MPGNTTDRKREILNAALGEFVENGISGARTQKIADGIGVTKAMIHYYFDTKENLFLEVYREACHTLFHDLLEVLETDVPLFHKLDQFIVQSIDRFQSYPELAAFVITAHRHNTESTTPILLNELTYEGEKFEEQLNKAASDYEIAQVDSRHVLINIISLCMFPYTGYTFVKAFLKPEDEDEYQVLLEQRKGIVSDTIINWLAG